MSNRVRSHTVAVVVPVYQGETTLSALLEDIEPLVRHAETPSGIPFRVREVVLVHDCGPDRSDVTIRTLAAAHSYVRPVWLSRNFGPHAATLAGMRETTSDWIVTMDEDGQHDPQAIGAMLDVALAERSMLVYAAPTNKPPHGPFRNVTSRLAHALARAMNAGRLPHFHSFRLIMGDVGRALVPLCGESVYLDVAMTWVISEGSTCPVAMRTERGRASGFSKRRLAAHFWRMVLTSGTRPLRLVTFAGLFLAALAASLTGWVVWAKFRHGVPVQGWTSVTVLLLVTTGVILFSIGILAEYLGVVARFAMGKPLFLTVPDPSLSPLGESD